MFVFFRHKDTIPKIWSLEVTEMRLAIPGKVCRFGKKFVISHKNSTMKNSTKYTVVLATLLLSTSLFAQKSNKKFNVLTETETIIKFTPTKIFQGIVEMGVEQGVGDRSSVEFNVGPTFSNVSPFGNGHGIIESINGFDNTTGSLMGFSFSGGFRFYPVEERWVMNGFYVSPIVSFKRYNYEFEDFLTGTLDSKNGFRQSTEFGFLFGTQSWLSKYFGIDMYAGMGLRSINSTRYYVESIYDNNTGNFTTSWKQDSDNRASWFISAGIKVGIGLPKK